MNGRPDLGSGLALLALALFAAFEAHGLALGSPGRPGPGFFPFTLALALALVAAALCLQALRRAGRAGAAAHREQATGAPRPHRGKVALTLLALAAYGLVVEGLGFPLATLLLMLFLFTAIEPQRWRVAVGASLGTSLGAYFLFQWLGVRLPPGRWFF